MSPVGRKELLDALHQAQKLQALLQELLVWAQRLRAEMDLQGAPCSPAGARHMLDEHQTRKVSSRVTGPLWTLSPPCCPFP